PGVLDVPSDDSEEELSWKSSEDEEVGGQDKGNESNDDSDDGSDIDSEETVKSGAVRRQEYEKRKTQKSYIVAGAVSAIPGIVHQYMDQQLKEAVREVVQQKTDQLQDSLQRENDEFLRNIDENMKNVLKGLVKTQVKEQVSRIL
nr:hypothetical protein [Tanacetum cinerariifolium]